MWHSGAVSLPQGDIILDQLACLPNNVFFVHIWVQCCKALYSYSINIGNKFLFLLANVRLAFTLDRRRVTLLATLTNIGIVLKNLRWVQNRSNLPVKTKKNGNVGRQDDRRRTATSVSAAVVFKPEEGDLHFRFERQFQPWMRFCGFSIPGSCVYCVFVVFPFRETALRHFLPPNCSFLVRFVS